MSKLKRVLTCHPDRVHYAKGFCKECYTSTITYKQLQRERSKKHYSKNKDQMNERARLWSKENKERKYKVGKEWLAKNINRYLLITAKQRAKKNNIELNLKATDIIVPTICPILGIPLIPFSGKFAHNSPSIDRIDSNKGYTKDNIIVISFRANCIKNNATVEELEKIYKFYSSLQSHDGNFNPR